MNTHQLLGQLSQLQEMMTELVLSVPEDKCYISYQDKLPSLAWSLGRCVYIETYWIREIIQQDDDMTARVRAIFGSDSSFTDELWSKIPPIDHLLNWALELQEQNLTLLANPSQLPKHALTEDDKLLFLILDEYAIRYEQMLMQLHEISLHTYQPFTSNQPLQALPPSESHAEMHGGHYRIGAKPEASARNRELPTQMVELSSFRIDTHPVSNGAWLSFMQAQGYETKTFWDEEGWSWLQHHLQGSHAIKNQPIAPHTWRLDQQQNWYSIALNGPCELIAEEPVSGICHHEALAYAKWVSSQEGNLAGAVLQHEFQWEASKRTGAFSSSGQVWEWCSNDIEPYSGYQPSPYPEAADRCFLDTYKALRSASLHTSRLLRRPRYRNFGKPDQRFMLSGLRLVFPPSDMPWH